MSVFSAPAPDFEDPLVGPFWQAARKRRLAMQKCSACGFIRWPPETLCPVCLSAAAEWSDLTGRGCVWSVAVYEHVYHPAFADDVPYTVALVKLDEGPFMISRIVDRDAPSIELDSRVSAVYAEREGAHLVYFEKEVNPE